MPSIEQSRKSRPRLGIDLGDEVVTFALQNDDGTTAAATYPARIGVVDGAIKTGKRLPKSSSQSITPATGTGLETRNDDGTSLLAVYLQHQLEKFHDKYLEEPREGDAVAEVGPHKETVETSQNYRDVTIVVPGSFTGADIDRIESAVRTTGLDNLRVFRRPTPLISRASPPPENQTVVGISFTEGNGDLGLYSINEKSCVTAIARDSDPSLGRRQILEDISETLIERTARNLGRTVEYEEKVLEVVSKEIVETVLSSPDPDQAGSIELTLSEGVQVLAGEEVVGDRLDIHTELSEEIVHAALESFTDTLLKRLQGLFETSDYDPEKIDRVFISGETTGLQVLSDAIEGFLGVAPSQPGDPVETMANAAVDLRGKLEDGTFRSVTDTVQNVVYLGAASEEGIEYQPIINPLGAVGRSYSSSLKTHAPEKQYGKFELQVRHPGSESVLERNIFEVTGLQPDPEAPREIAVKVVPTSEDLRGEDRMDVSIHTDGGGTPKVANKTDPDAPWLIHTDTPEEADIPGSTDRVYRFARAAESGSEDDVDLEQVAEIIHRTRSLIWSHGIKDQEAFSPTEIEKVLSEFDSRLERLGIHFFEPTLGTELNPSRERAREVKESDEDEGTIIEVIRPGVLLNGEVIDEAQVVIAGD